MKLPLSWLGEFVTVEAEVAEICRRLTLAGLEVEGIEQLEATFTEVFVAKVLAVERHPNADRLHVCEVDAGPAGQFRIVCGAPNARAGMTAALAKIGARLGGGVHGEGGGRLTDVAPLQAAVIRGVPSEGMLCSELELGLSKEHEGILELAADAAPGASLATYLGLPDVVLDIAITPNRGDCLSILGLAREVAALINVPLRLPPIRPLSASPSADPLRLAIDLAAPELCPRYAALALNRITLGPSPAWMKRRLELCGMRSVNNVVDVTNYVMLELGQPLHAFDAARIADHRIIVRRAGDDHDFATLDGARRTLTPDDLVIADRDQPLAIAGVMGGQNSEVSSTTTSIILESAYFEPITIARTARRLGLRSEASYRFERGIDRAGQLNGLLRAADLIGQTAGGSPASAALDVEPKRSPPRTIHLDLAAMSAILGITLPAAEVKRRLRAIGAEVAVGDQQRLAVTAPSFRPDLNETADLCEEVARLAGLSEIPAIAPTRTAIIAAPDSRRTFTRKIREILTGTGLVEAKTIAFISPAENERFPNFAGAAPVRVTNPLSAELSEMRASLLPGLLTALRFNLNREATQFHMFELGRAYGLRDGGATEFERIAAVSFGDFAMGAIGHPPIRASFATIKGILETFFRSLTTVGAIAFERLPAQLAPYLHPSKSAVIKCTDGILGVVGELHPEESLKLELTGSCVLFELDGSAVAAYGAQASRSIVAPPRFPAVRKDVALVVDRDLPAAMVTKALADLDVTLLESVVLFDVYTGDSLPPGKKSVAVACRYRSKDRTLTDDEVNRAHATLVEKAAAQLGAELRQ